MFTHNLKIQQKITVAVLLATIITHVSFNLHAQHTTPSPLPKPAQMITDPYNDASQVGYCLDQAGSNSCTANDFTITSIRTINVDDGCTSPTDYMQIDLEVTFAKQTPTRYDVGAWFYRGVDATSGADFNNEDAINGSFCNRVGVAPGLITPDGDVTVNLPNDDGVCMDVPSGSPGNLSPQVLNDIILPCRDITNATFGLVPDGITDISACTSWQNNAVNGCAGPQYQEFDLAWPNSPFSSEIQPQTGSKCNCAEFDGGPTLVQIPDIDVTKSCTPEILEPGETTICTITITNSGLGALNGASSINTSGFFYEDDYPENQGSIGAINPSTGVSAVDGFTKDANADDTTNQSLNIYPGTIAANGGSVTVVYEFITSPSLPSTETTITNTVCAAFYNDNATAGNLPDDAVFQYTSTEPGQCSTAVVTTPVGIASFYAKESPLGGYDISWTTSTETGNLGFNLYAIAGQTRYQLNKRLIPSKSVDSMKIESYQYQVNSQLFGFIDKFIIEDVDRLGRKHTNGVYSLNKKYGYEEKQQDKVETKWTDINLAHASKEKDKQGQLLSNYNNQNSYYGSEKSSSNQYNSNSTSKISIDLEIEKTGIYRISYQDLSDFGVDLQNLKNNAINISYRGEIIPIDIVGFCRRGHFCNNSYLQFYAQSNETLYSDKNIYVLNLYSVINSPKIPGVTGVPRGRNFEKSYNKTIKLNRNLVYSYGSPIDSEPWYDTNIFAYNAPKYTSFDLNLENLSVDGGGGKISFSYWGGLDFPDDDNDHSIKFEFNGKILGSDQFDGITARHKEFLINANELQQDSIVGLELPANTVNEIDIISLESIALTYPASFIANNNELTFENLKDSVNFKIDGFSDKYIQIFAISETDVIKLNKFKTTKTSSGKSVRFSKVSGYDTYILSTESSVLKPQMRYSQIVDLEIEATEHLVISHPDFMGESLKNYVKNTRDNYRIINVEDIYKLYSNSIPDGEAIKRFIEDSAKFSALSSILLVGGDNYDYKNYLGLNAISFVPTIYRETDSLIKYSAVDALYGDTDNDGLPDVAVGRFPVRTEMELTTILNKSMLYNSQVFNPSVVLVADNSDAFDAYSFTESSNQLASGFLNNNWDVKKGYLDEMSLDQTRQLLIDEMNLGVRLAMYTGHSSSKRWAFEGIFRNSDMDNLYNENAPFGVIQWGCWNTYFVEPEEDSLGHVFMLSGNKGASFVVGASTLTNAGEESRFSSIFNLYMLAEGMTLGEAITKAKREYHNESSQINKDILWGISLLGDPLIYIN